MPDGTQFEVGPGAHIKLPNYITLLSQEQIDGIRKTSNKSQRVIAAGTSPSGEIVMVTGDGRFLQIRFTNKTMRCQPSIDGKHIVFNHEGEPMNVPSEFLIEHSHNLGLLLEA